MNEKAKLTIATRESPLALWQANWVKQALERIHPDLSIDLLGMTTEADRLLATPLYKVGGKGLFVKELEQALLAGKADIAVHSMKDVPMELPADLVLPVVCQRDEARDVFVSNDFTSLDALPIGAIVGTSSLRRQSQLLAIRNDLTIKPLRGNISTRLSKLDKGEFAAIILAAAGLQRLNLQSRIQSFFNIQTIIPAAGQGMLGIECRANDEFTQQLIASLNDTNANDCVTAERAMCCYLGGGCHVPIAAFATIQEGNLLLRGLVASTDGKILLRAEQAMPRNEAEKLGIIVAKKLLQQGAEEILAQ